MNRKVVYNACYGGFSLSLEAQKLYLEMHGYQPKLHEGKSSWEKHYYINEPYDFYDREVERHDPILVAVVEELGEKANGGCADLCIRDIGDLLYRIKTNDGYETVEVFYVGDEWK